MPSVAIIWIPSHLVGVKAYGPTEPMQSSSCGENTKLMTGQFQQPFDNVWGSRINEQEVAS